MTISRAVLMLKNNEDKHVNFYTKQLEEVKSYIESNKSDDNGLSIAAYHLSSMPEVFHLKPIKADVFDTFALTLKTAKKRFERAKSGEAADAFKKATFPRDFLITVVGNAVTSIITAANDPKPVQKAALAVVEPLVDLLKVLGHADILAPLKDKLLVGYETKLDLAVEVNSARYALTHSLTAPPASPVMQPARP